MGLNTRLLTQRAGARALALGFDLFGVAPHAAPATSERLPEWVSAGYAGEMGYLARRLEQRANPAVLMPEGRAIVVVGKFYRSAEPPTELWNDPSRGRIARYAWGQDYHDVLLPLLKRLVSILEDECGRPVRARPYVDTGPVLERPIASAAGLGFIGKNTLLIHPRRGSWLFLSEILVDVELEPNLEPSRVGCGSCTRCLQACPTKAFVGPHVLDARRCISYLTIESKGPIEPELRPLMGNRIFGCDDCQEVCPWNIRFGEPADAEFWRPDVDRIAPRLLDLIGLDARRFRERFQGTPLMRPGRRGLLRNVAIALGNWGDERAVPALGAALADDEPILRGHAAWALGRIGTRQAIDRLSARRRLEPDSWVRQEIEHALER